MPLPFLVVVFLLCCLFSVLYWQVIQPVALQSVRFRLFARRDHLRALAITGTENYNDPAYTELEEFICKTIALLPAINLLWFTSYLLGSKEKESENYRNLRRRESPHMKELMDRSVGDALMMMFFNSPIVAFSFLLFAFYLYIVGKTFMIYRKTEDFIDALPADVAAQPA
jgi:hypothetical protein